MKREKTVQLNEITISSAKQLDRVSHVDEDLVIFDEIAYLPLPKEPRRVGCMIFALCMKGELQYCIDTEKHTLHAGDVVLMNTGQVTNDLQPGSDSSGIAIMISKSFLQDIIKYVHGLTPLFLFSRSHPVFKLTEEEIESIKKFVHLTKMKIDKEDNKFRKKIAQALITAMIYDLSNAIYRVQNDANRKQNRTDIIFKKFIELVEKNFKAERRVGWYAEQLGISAKYMSESVKHSSHKTPNEWIDNYVIMETKVLQKSSSLSVKEIAQHLSFPNQSFLSKFFKERVGISPLTYRKS